MADTAAPKLTSLVIPASIDVSTGKTTVTVTASADDGAGGSGIDAVDVVVDRSLVMAYGASDSFRMGDVLDADTFRDGTPGSASERLTLTGATPPGTYHISEVRVSDLAGNQTTYTPPQLAALGIRTEFQVRGGVADTTAPKLVALSLPTTIDFTAGAFDIPIRAEATDTGGSGLAMVVFYLDEFVASTYGTTNNFSIRSSDVRDTFTGTVPTVASGKLRLSDAAAPGTYHLKQVALTDLAGNQSVYDAKALADLGIGNTFQLTGTKADTTAPSLLAFDLPRLIDLGKGAAGVPLPVPFSVRAADEAGGSGIDSVIAFLDHHLVLASGPSSGLWTLQSLDDDTFDDDTPAAASGHFDVAAAAAPGAYHISGIKVNDRAGNSAYYDATQLAGLGISTTFSVTDGKLPPPPVVQASGADTGKEVTLKVGTTAWSPGANVFQLTFGYDPTQVHFKGITVVGGDTGSTTFTTSETGHVGTAIVHGTATLDGAAGGALFLNLTRAQAGPVTYELQDLAINGVSQALDAASTGKAFLGAGTAERIAAADAFTHIDGGAGVDTAAFSGKASVYAIQRTATGFDVDGAGGAHVSLAHVERLAFADGALALDTYGAGGQVYRLYQAAFDRKPDAGGVGYWMHLLDHGTSNDAIAKAFIGSLEFAAKYGAHPDDAAFVTALYQNVLHRAPDQGGFDYWLKTLEKVERSSVLIGFADSAENVAQVADVIGNGFVYTPWG